jgi:hypothetical protein
LHWLLLRLRQALTGAAIDIRTVAGGAVAVGREVVAGAVAAAAGEAAAEEVVVVVVAASQSASNLRDG